MAPEDLDSESIAHRDHDEEAAVRRRRREEIEANLERINANLRPNHKIADPEGRLRLRLEEETERAEEAEARVAELEDDNAEAMGYLRTLVEVAGDGPTVEAARAFLASRRG